MKNNPPSVEAVVKEFRKQFPNCEVYVPADGAYYTDNLQVNDFLRQHLTLMYEKGRAEANEFAQSVIELDQTPTYTYGDINNKGEKPSTTGSRWKTPKEMAKDFLKTSARSTHEK
jgi:hypothetical protein